MAMKIKISAFDAVKLWRTGWLMGCLAGLVFSLAAWGMDAVILIQARAIFPWFKLLAGTFIAVGLGGLCGYIGARVNTGFATF